MSLRVVYHIFNNDHMISFIILDIVLNKWDTYYLHKYYHNVYNYHIIIKNVMNSLLYKRGRKLILYNNESINISRCYIII